MASQVSEKSAAEATPVVEEPNQKEEELKVSVFVFFSEIHEIRFVRPWWHPSPKQCTVNSALEPF
jgi:hypothetical protein